MKVQIILDKYFIIDAIKQISSTIPQIHIQYGEVNLIITPEAYHRLYKEFKRIWEEENKPI